MQVGALDYILKPFKLNVILPVIARALDVASACAEKRQTGGARRQRSEELAAAYQDLESFSYSISHESARAAAHRRQLRADAAGGLRAAAGEEGGASSISFSAQPEMDELIVDCWNFRAPGGDVSNSAAST